MGNLFDKLQKGAAKVVHSTFGYMVSWQPLAGGDPFTAKILFKEPTKKDETGGMEFSPFSYSMEYDRDELPGLLEYVRAGNDEVVNIYQIGETTAEGKEYDVRTVDAIFDGKNYMALLELKQ